MYFVFDGHDNKSIFERITEFITMELQELHGNIYPLFSYFPSNSHSLLHKAIIIVVSFPKTMVASGSNIMAVSCSIVMGEYDGTVSNTMVALVSNTMLGSGSNTMLGKFSVGQCPAGPHMQLLLSFSFKAGHNLVHLHCRPQLSFCYF